MKENILISSFVIAFFSIFTASTVAAKAICEVVYPKCAAEDTGNILSEKYGICVRGGYHCAPKKHEALGTIDTGLVRVSFSLFNTLQEVEKLIFAIKQILKTKTLANC